MSKTSVSDGSFMLRRAVLKTEKKARTVVKYITHRVII
jgi:hypothetical protein